MKNGRANHDDEEPRDPKIARFEEERRRRQRGEGAKPGAAAGVASGASKPRMRGGSLKEWLIGAVIAAMAVGMVVSFGRTALIAVGALGR